jgi:hypothetical protein
MERYHSDWTKQMNYRITFLKYFFFFLLDSLLLISSIIMFDIGVGAC